MTMSPAGAGAEVPGRGAPAGAECPGGGAAAERGGQVLGLGRVAADDLDGVASFDPAGADGAGVGPEAEDADAAHDVYLLSVGRGWYVRARMGVAADRGRDEARHSGQRTGVRRRLRGRQCGPPTQAPAWLRRLLCVRPNNVFDAGLVWRSRAAIRAL